jgi:transposase
MPLKRLLMRKIREILRLKYEAGLSHRAIARSCCVAPGTVHEYVRRAREASLAWPLPMELDDGRLEAKLFAAPAPGPRPRPDLAFLHQELKRPGVTLLLLWQEYRAVHASGYSYSQFCDIYRRWAKRLKPSMRQVHRAGEKTFLDYAGQRPHLVDPKSGEVVPVELFVGVLGASSYTYAEATLSQQLPDWVGAHARMLTFFGGSTEIWVPDNLKSGVTGPCRYEPEVNRTYQEMATHYGAVVIPARVRRPKDKAKVESAVQVAERWILAALRDRTFFTLAELNAAIRELLDDLNRRPMQKLGVSRRELFERLDRPALKALPTDRYEIGVWKPCRVNIDYHVEVERNVYSVPYQLVRETVEARLTTSMVEIFFKNKRVASHRRRLGRGGASTQLAHMPRSHRAHAEWTPSRLIRWAEKAGPATGHLVAEILRHKVHPEQGYRACLGIMRLGRRHGDDRLEAACARATRLGAFSYQTVKNILNAGLDRLPLENDGTAPPQGLAHDNIRGATYYVAAQEDDEC